MSNEPLTAVMFNLYVAPAINGVVPVGGTTFFVVVFERKLAAGM